VTLFHVYEREPCLLGKLRSLGEIVDKARDLGVADRFNVASTDELAIEQRVMVGDRGIRGLGEASRVRQLKTDEEVVSSVESLAMRVD